MSIAEQTKTAVLKMYNGHCAYCGASLRRGTVTIDHVFPKVKGGRRTPNNIKPSCSFCNLYKGSNNIEGFRKKILKEIKHRTKYASTVKNRYKFKNGNVVFYFESVEAEYVNSANRIEAAFEQIRKERELNDNSRED